MGRVPVQGYVWQLAEARVKHAAAVSAVRVTIGNDPACRLWPNNSGIATHKHGNHTSRVRYGLCPGSSDLIGIIGPKGRMLAIEVKVGSDQLSEEQDLFLRLVRAFGGFGCELRVPADASDDDVQAAARVVLERARGGAHE